MNIVFTKKLSSHDLTLPTVVLVPEKETRVRVLSDNRISITIGVDDRKKVTRRKLILLARQAIILAKANKIKEFVIHFENFLFPKANTRAEELAQILGENFEMANFEFVKYKTPPREGWNFVERIVVITPKNEPQVARGFKKGQLIGQEVNACRVLANTPGGEMTPKLLAKAAEEAARGTGVTVRVLGKKEIKELNMGGVLGVSQGSTEEPKFIVLEYLKGRKSEKPIVLVGKGVTFDTGGLNLKPSEHIYEMHMDMSGGAAVIHAVTTIAKLGLRRNVVGIVPAVENMPSGSSYHPGDILRSMSGKTIEVLNTDAEGRIILADGLTYAERYAPRLVVDVATLTGAAEAALGQRASAFFTKDIRLQKTFSDLGEASGDYVWPFPLWDEYEDEIKGTFGDIINTSKTRYGGAITGAMFLYQFAKKYPWVHIDMAPRMTSIDGEYLAKGAAGAPVRLLVRLIEHFS